MLRKKPWRDNKTVKFPRKPSVRGGDKRFKGFKTNFSKVNLARNKGIRARPGYQKASPRNSRGLRGQSQVSSFRPRHRQFPRRFQNKWKGKKFYRKKPAGRYNRFKGKPGRYNNGNFKKNKYFSPDYVRFFDKEINFKNFARAISYFFKRDAGADKKLALINYWESLKRFTEDKFSFTFPIRDGVFYKGVIRSYMKAIAFFVKSFLKRLRHHRRQKYIKRILVVRAYYRVYKVIADVQHLSKIYMQGFERPIYYFKGYQSFLRGIFFRILVVFIMKIFISTNRVFGDNISRIKNHNDFFMLWKKVYKGWLNRYYQEPSRSRLVPRMDKRAFLGAKTLISSYRNRDLKALALFRFRRDRLGYKKTLKNYFFKYALTNFKTHYPFSYKRKKVRFRHSVLGKKIYLQKKRLFRRKSRKYIRWFRTLVTGAYYTSKIHAEKTFFKAGYGKRAWISRRRAKHVFKMKFVFIRYFSKKFGLKNRTAFLRKAEHIARKRGDKWLRYYREFESRLQRVLVLFNLCANDRVAKSLINANLVVVNRRVLNDHNYKIIPRVKMGDLVSLANAAVPGMLKKKFKFFKKRLDFVERGDEAKLLYKLFKKYFLEWICPSVYAITGSIIKHGFSALMSGPVVRNSKVYFSINRRIPFYNRELFKIFIQRFSKKLN